MTKREHEISDNEEPVSSKTQRRKVDYKSHLIELAHNAYTVGWVCALPKEQTAATAMLDQRRADLPKPPGDPNTYTLGSVGKHNVVIACLPKGEIGNNPAATIVAWMISTFPSIKVGLMVGIGGGIPPKVRLGDVVVSTPVRQYPGVVQWDFGKAERGSKFERTGALNNPPISLLTALAKLETEHELVGSKVPAHLEGLKRKWPRLSTKYLKSDPLEDVLFRADYSHVGESTDGSNIPGNDDGEGEEQSCRFCDRAQALKRMPRDMRVHYGLVASGNQVIKDAAFRDKLNEDLGGNVLCIEMEAAGLMNSFPCIVIRGICDYADSHKNKDWQEYAAAVAAAFAKELLEHVQPSDIGGERIVKDVLGQVFDTVSTMRSKLDGKEDLEILNWITPFDYGSRLSDYFQRRQAGTGQWLLNSAEFQEWLKTSQKTLFCPGIPGAGKTILTSVVVNDLAKHFSEDSSVGIAYVYCNFQRKDEQKIDDLLASLLKQLAESYPPLPESVKDLYDRHKAKRTRPSLEEISATLHSVAAKYSRVFIIVDALDECQASDGCRARLLSELFNLQKRHGTNILATSRFIPEIVDQFKGSSELEIRASREDVERYLKGHIRQLSPFVQENQQLQADIISGISEAVDGMFLLAQIYFSSLNDKLTPNAIRNALQDFQKQTPRSSEDKKVQVLAHAYEQAMKRINGQMPGFKGLANKVLSWITCAKRQITTTELQHALAVEVSKPELDEQDFYKIQDVVSVCAGLVTIDNESDIIRLVHFTTQEYFERTQKDWFPTAETDITKTCVTYLSFSVFNSGICATDEEFEERLQSNRLYDYAARNWGHHARAASTVMEQLIQDLLENETNISAASQAMMASGRFSGYSQTVPRQMTGVHVAAYFGLVRTIKGLLKIGYNPGLRDSYGRMPLSWAAANGHKAVVELLLATDEVDLDSKDWNGRTALSRAAANGHEAVVKLLLAGDGVGPDSKDSWRRTPLLRAAASGHEAAVKLLLATGGVDPDSKDSKRQTPLSWAAANGRRAVVKLLLATGGVDLDSKDSKGQTPLSRAAANGHEAVVKLLLARDEVDPDSKDWNGRTPLSWAAANGREAVVKLLLARDEVDLDSKDWNGRTPLSWAAANGYKAVAKLLLAGDEVDLDSIGMWGRTPLSWTAANAYEAVVKLLLARDRVDLDSKDRWGRTPLSWAAANGHETVVKLLLARDRVDLDSKDRWGRTPLSQAAASGHETVVKLLQSRYLTSSPSTTC